MINVEDELDDSEPPSDMELRMVALEQAVALHAGTTSDVDVVLTALAGLRPG